MDRYNRLKNLKEFGYNVDWSILHKKKVAIIGVGGLGAVSSEMLTRCGIGELLLFDLDIVNEVNLNRLFFLPSHIGKPKVEVVAQGLKQINSNVEIRPYFGDIMRSEFDEEFERLISESDLVLQGLDNMPARQFLNRKCVKINRPFIDAGASRSGMGGYIQPVIPGKTGCYVCVGNYKLPRKKEQGEPCTASLPTTMAILAGIQVQEALKYFLQFAPLAEYITYDAVANAMYQYHPQRDPNCPICGDLALSQTRNPEKFTLPKSEILSDSELEDRIKTLQKEYK